MDMNEALVQDGYDMDDPLRTLKLVSKAIPTPAPRQVVVHVTLRPINPTDFIMLRLGTNSHGGTGGAEGVGVVHKVGEGVTKVHEGQRVVPFTAHWSLTGNGAFQKYVCLDEAFVWPVPDYLSDEVAAQFVVNPWTSYSVLQDLQVPKGKYIIQTAAGSVLGKQVISLAQHWGFKTINVVRRPEQKAELKKLGAHEVICSEDEDIAERVKEITAGEGAWGAVEVVCGDMTKKVAASVRVEGVVLLMGVLGGYDAVMNAVDLVVRQVTLKGWSIYSRVMEHPDRCQALAPLVAPLVRDGVIPTAKVAAIFELSDFKAAFAKAQQPGLVGKVMLRS